MPNNCLLLMDSFTGQTDDLLYENKSNKTLVRKTIPPRTTGVLQPLDVGVFRYCKSFCKRITNYIILNKINIKLKDREFIIKMWSLIYNQFSSDIFTEFFKNSFNCLNINNDNIEVNNVYNSLFKIKNIKCNQCNNNTFICCSYCKCNLCFNHFIVEYHYHK